jgi:hypothetical protein
MKYGCIVLIFALAFLLNEKTVEIQSEIKADQEIINRQDSLIKIYKKSLSEADKAIENFKIERQHVIDSLNRHWENATDEEIINTVRANRRD